MSMLESVEKATVSILNRVLGDDIFSQLKGEHRDLLDLLDKAEHCSVSERKQCLQQIEETLVPHARGEEKTLYAVMHERLKAIGETDSEIKELSTDAMNLTNEAYEEHRAVDMLMADLKATPVEDERWIARLTVIRENLEHHIKEEENDLFAKADELLSSEERSELLEAYLERKEHYAQSLPTQSQINAKVPSTEASKLI